MQGRATDRALCKVVASYRQSGATSPAQTMTATVAMSICSHTATEDLDATSTIGVDDCGIGGTGDPREEIPRGPRETSLSSEC